MYLRKVSEKAAIPHSGFCVYKYNVDIRHTMYINVKINKYICIVYIPFVDYVYWFVV